VLAPRRHQASRSVFGAGGSRITRRLVS
jgi:hypothetical protein